MHMQAANGMTEVGTLRLLVINAQLWYIPVLEVIGELCSHACHIGGCHAESESAHTLIRAPPLVNLILDLLCHDAQSVQRVCFS